MADAPSDELEDTAPETPAPSKKIKTKVNAKKPEKKPTVLGAFARTPQAKTPTPPAEPETPAQQQDTNNEPLDIFLTLEDLPIPSGGPGAIKSMESIDWKLGVPVPADVWQGWFKIENDFTEHEPADLPADKLENFISGHESTANRLKAQPIWGLTQRPVSRVARRYSGSVLESRRNTQTKGGKRSQRQDNVEKLWQIVAGLELENHHLHERLLSTNATIVWKNTSRAMRAADEDGDAPILSEIDTLHSQVATLFAILRHFPNRFRSYSKNPEKPEEHIWGFSHEDWFRAHVCLQRHLLRRQKHDNITVKDTQGEIKDWPGFFRSAVSIDDEHREQQDSRALQSLQSEHSLLGDGWLQDMPLNADRLATQDDIIDAFGEDVANQLEYNKGRLDDSLGQLAEFITTGISATLADANPSTDPFEEDERRRAKKKLPPPSYPSAKELKFFGEMLLKRAHVAYDKSLPHGEISTLLSEDDSNDSEFQLAAHQLQLQRGAQDYMAAEEEPPSTGKQFNGVQNLLGEFLPEHDLEDVCEVLGISDWRNLELNPEHAPGKRLKPNQLIDAYELHLKLESFMHAAFLTSDCGIGKTNTMLACLKISVQRRVETWESTPWPLQEDERVFKPTVYMCPSSVLDQTFQEFSEWWGGYFRVYVCYQTEATCSNSARKRVTLGSLKQAQGVFDKLAEEHEDPLTARTIILCAYDTAIRRFAVDKGQAVGRSKRVPDPALEIDDGENDLDPEDLEVQDELGNDEAVTLRELALKNVQLYRLILDEGHAVKNVKSARNQILQQFNYEAIIIASATILSNHVRDFYGYIELIWDKDLPFSWDNATSKKAETWYDIATWTKLVRGINTPDIDADRIYRATEDEMDEQPATPQQIRKAGEYRAHIKETGEPIFLMNPQLFYAFANSSRHSPSFAQNAIRTIMQMLCVRRSMLSKMTLPDGTITWPGKGIPPLSCNEVEFDMPVQAKPKVREVIMRLHANLTTQGPRSKSFKSRHGAKVGASAVQMNGNAMRRMVLASTNVHNIRMTSPFVRTTKLLKDVSIQKIIGHAVNDSNERVHNVKGRPLLTPSVEYSSQALTPLQERQREGLQRRKRADAVAGTAEMNRVATHDPTKGLQWAFYLTRDSARDMFPESAIGRVRWLCFDSPKYCWTLAKVIELHLKGQRALVYVNNPLTGQMILAMLEALGIRTLSIQSKHSQGERDSAVKKFNSVNMPISALVTSLQLCGFGVNFHLACHHGIIVERPYNLGNQIQAIGRLWRTNQKKEVHWWVLHQRDSYDAFVDARNLEKYATTLAAEGNINDSITGEYRIICAYEILRCYLGQESNRYPRLRVAWHKMDTQKVRLEGFFYTAVARFLFRNPDKQDRITADTIGGIAARWELGSELTIAHVEPGRPDCPPDIDPENPGRVSLSSAREQAKALEENMAMFQCEGVEEDEPDEQPEGLTDVGGRKRKRIAS
ncbi:hypothetical protein ACHAP8_003556 [Fusarium lateritium]